MIVTGISFVTSQNFKREEQNFVVQNEINNMSFLISDTKSKMSKVFVCVLQSSHLSRQKYTIYS